MDAEEPYESKSVPQVPPLNNEDLEDINEFMDVLDEEDESDDSDLQDSFMELAMKGLANMHDMSYCLRQNHHAGA